jgi:hypothetical protein
MINAFWRRGYTKILPPKPKAKYQKESKTLALETENHALEIH